MGTPVPTNRGYVCAIRLAACPSITAVSLAMKHEGNHLARVPRLTDLACIVALITAQPSNEQRKVIFSMSEGLHGDEATDGKGAIGVDDYRTALGSSGSNMTVSTVNTNERREVLCRELIIAAPPRWVAVASAGREVTSLPGRCASYSRIGKGYLLSGRLVVQVDGDYIATFYRATPRELLAKSHAGHEVGDAPR